MARDTEPVSEDALAALRDDLKSLRERVREDLAQDLGGDPDDYDAEAYLNDRADEPVADGGRDA